MIMKGISIKVFMMALAIGMGSQAQAHVSLDNPVGEETFISGSTLTIAWTELVAHNTQYWDLHFSSDGGATWEPIQVNIPHSTTSLDWTVPEISTWEGVVRVTQVNQGMNYEHQCLNFTVSTITAPPEVTNAAQELDIECSQVFQEAIIQSWLDDHGTASATSSCGALVWENDYTSLLDDCGGVTGDAMVIFTVTDECGNNSTTTAAITVRDNTAPVINVSAQDMTVECDGSFIPQQAMAWLSSHGGAMATDECGMVIWANDYDFEVESDGCAFTGTITVIFTVSDECGNMSTTDALLTVEDTSPPVVETSAADITIECSTTDQQVDIQTWIATHGGATASDLCGNLIWANNYAGLSDQCGTSGIAEVTFTITDECGNSSTTKANLTVLDSEPPILEKQALDITVECDDPDRGVIIQIWLDDIAGATATDLCGDVTWSNNYTEPTEACMDQTTEPVTFTATDECGNSVTSVASIKNSLSTGINDVRELSDVRTYPNPTNDVLHIDFGADQNVQKSILLFEIGGKLVWKGNGISSTWDIMVRDFSKGIYLLKLKTADGSLVQKVIVE